MCKAALAQYYQDLNASRTEANQAQGGTEGADGPHEDFDAGAAETAGSGNVSAGTTDAAGAAGLMHAALRQQLTALQLQLQALQVAIVPGTHDPGGPTTGAAASGGGPTTGAADDNVVAYRTLGTEGPQTLNIPEAFSARRAQGVLLKNAPTPNKAAALQWKAHLNPNLALMAENLQSLMGLIGKAWSGRADML